MIPETVMIGTGMVEGYEGIFHIVSIGNVLHFSRSKEKTISLLTNQIKIEWTALEVVRRPSVRWICEAVAALRKYSSTEITSLNVEKEEE